MANTIYYEDMERVSRELGDDYHVGMEYTTTYRMPRKDGSLFWVLDKGRVVESGDHRLAILSYCMDITEIMERQLDLRRSVTDLEQQNRELRYLNNTIPVGYHGRAKTTFLSNMSHDIRTPMNAHVAKPLNVETLTASLERVLSKGSAPFERG